MLGENPAPTVLVQHQQYLDPGPSSGPTCSAGARAVLGTEPRTSHTLSENHATRPNSQLIEVARDPKNSLHASDTAPPAAEHSGRAEFSGVGAEWRSLGQKLSRMGVWCRAYLY